MIIRGRYIEALATIHVRNGKPQDLTDDELREFGLMNDLVERLSHKNVRWMTPLLSEAADRIEQIERELAAEKALADRLANSAENLQIGVGMGWDLGGMMENLNNDLATYRKARGL